MTWSSGIKSEGVKYVECMVSVFNTGWVDFSQKEPKRYRDRRKCSP